MPWSLSWSIYLFIFNLYLKFILGLENCNRIIRNLCWGLTILQPFWVILCRLSEKGREEKRDSRRDEREEQGRKRNRNESEETEEIKTFPLYPYLLQGQQALPNCKPVSAGRPGNAQDTQHLRTPTLHLPSPSGIIRNKIWWKYHWNRFISLLKQKIS